MTLPTELILPLNADRLESGDPGLIGQYIRELVTTLSKMYQDLAQATNGDIREFPPKIIGLTTPGVGTYTVQDGWYLREGLIVDYWFVVGWSGHTGTGQAYVQLPYKVKKTISLPFVSSVHGQYNYAATYSGLFGTATSDTFRYDLYAEGPLNIAVLPLPLLTSGLLFSHIRYIGQEIEN